MNKIEKFKDTYTILFCIIVEVIWLVLLHLFGFGLNTVMPKVNYFVLLIINEVLVIAVSLLLLKIANKTDVLLHKGCGIRKGMSIGMFLLVLYSFAFLLQLIIFLKKRTSTPSYLFMVIIIFAICVGMAEELLFRGLIATLLIDKYGTSRKGIWKAAVITALLFGLAHLSNIFSGVSINGVLIQAAVAIVMGLLLTAIYYRSGSIWTVVILHGFIDLLGFLRSGFNGIKLADIISNYNPVGLFACVIYFIPVLFLFRKKKLSEIEKHFCKANSGESYSN